ncbi:GntR family transcriptional regulator [Cumulibacter manganitolerans]|uniref:GntR family transcriptional regulator n=1 Tax=Cumulibacter manganitolerans TaxID=1884992 RepID=UPI001298060D|nr:GntR family transcriptional regulator [Cumulibacter manganitolerans]
MTAPVPRPPAFVREDGARLSPQIGQWLRERILSGHFAPHEKLKPEHLAEIFGASATPVREALMTLHGEGLVSLAPGRGFAVQQLTQQDIEDVLSAHAHFAAMLAERAARTLEDADIHRLREIQARIVSSGAAGDLLGLERLDDEFHRVINRAAGSARLKWLYSTTFRFVPNRLFDEIDGFAEAAIEDHVLVIKGLVNRNPEATAAAMRAHWLNVGTMLVRHMRAHGTLAD